MKYPTELTGQEVGGIYIHEPGALVSNIAIVLTCFSIAWIHRNTTGRGARFWVLFVICLGIAASGGMISHGFPTYLSPLEYFLIWWIKNTFILLGNLFAGLAVFTFTRVSVRKLSIVLTIKFFLFAFLLYVLYDFLPAVIDLAVTYLTILFITWRNSEIKAARILKRSFLIALFSGLFYLTSFSYFDGWFTNKDAVHAFAILSLVLVSKSVEFMKRGVYAM